MLRIAIITVLAVALTACSSCRRQTHMAGDVYEVRLAMESLQTYVGASNDNLNAEIRGVRASQSEHLNDIERRLDEIQRALADLEDAIERLRLTGSNETASSATGNRVRRQLVLPEDPELRPRGTSEIVPAPAPFKEQ